MWRISLQWHLYRNRNNWCKNEFTGEKGKSGQFCDMFAKYVDNAPIMCAWYLIRNFQIKKRNYTIYQHVYLILFGNGAWTPTEKNEDFIWLFNFSDSTCQTFYFIHTAIRFFFISCKNLTHDSPLQISSRITRWDFYVRKDIIYVNIIFPHQNHLWFLLIHALSYF